MFDLSRAIVELLAPANFCLLLLICSLYCLLLRKIKIGIACLAVSISLQIFFGYGLVVRDKFIRMESTYPPLTKTELTTLKDKPIRNIVVLGSDHVSDRRLPPNSQLGGASLYRLVEGMRILSYFPEARLVVTGGIGYDPVANAKVVAETAISLGVPASRILVKDRPRDTLQEAEVLWPVLGGDEFILVTSAQHMPRAMSIFTGRGMRPIPAPTDYLIKQQAVAPPGTLFPSPGNQELAKRLLYEWIAGTWQKIKEISGNFP